MATQGLSVVTKLKSWDEFFDPEELQTGIACMKQSMKALTERSDEEDGSDSEPSVDNYEQDELEDNLQAALDPHEEGEANPFERPFEEEEPEPSAQMPFVKELSMKDPSEDNMSIQSNEQITAVAKEEVASQSEEDVKSEAKEDSEPINLDSER